MVILAVWLLRYCFLIEQTSRMLRYSLSPFPLFLPSVYWWIWSTQTTAYTVSHSTTQQTVFKPDTVCFNFSTVQSIAIFRLLQAEVSTHLTTFQPPYIQYWTQYNHWFLYHITQLYTIRNQKLIEKFISLWNQAAHAASFLWACMQTS